MESKRDIIITIPKTTKWEDYEKELESVKTGEVCMGFKVSQLPKTKPERCYVCYKGEIMGWMNVMGMLNDEFACEVTGKKWKGNFIYRSGEFHYLPNPKPKMKGFQGFRYYDRGQE